MSMKDDLRKYLPSEEMIRQVADQAALDESMRHALDDPPAARTTDRPGAGRAPAGAAKARTPDGRPRRILFGVAAALAVAVPTVLGYIVGRSDAPRPAEPDEAEATAVSTMPAASTAPVDSALPSALPAQATPPDASSSAPTTEETSALRVVPSSPTPPPAPSTTTSNENFKREPGMRPEAGSQQRAPSDSPTNTKDLHGSVAPAPPTVAPSPPSRKPIAGPPNY